MCMNKRIRQYIKSKGLNFLFVASNAGIEYKKFSRLMNKQTMTTDEYEQICRDGLKLDPSFFYSEKFLETKNATA